MSKERSNFQIKAEYYAVRGLMGAISIFPLKFSIKIGENLGRFINFAFPRLRKIGRRNLEIALPEASDAEKEKILRGTFENLGRQLGFISHFRKFTPETFQILVDVENLEYFDEAYRSERGVLFFTGHLGGWEVLNLALADFGFKSYILVRRIDNPLIENLVENIRNKFGTRTIDKKSSARTMLRLLQKHETLGILNDLNSQEHEGIFVDFFGVPASTASGLAKLALRTDSVVLPAFAVWQAEKQRYLIKIEPPVEYEKTGDDRRDIFELTQKVTAVTEKYVRAFPDQWLWIHKRWNTRPKGEPGLY